MSGKNERVILIVSEEPQLQTTVRQAVDSSFTIHLAQNRTAGWNLVTEKHPDIIVIGELKPAEEIAAFYRQLKDGWISRHSSVILVEKDPLENNYRILSDKDLLVCGEQTILAGKEISPIPTEQLPTGLAEKIRNLLSLRENKFKSDMLDPSCFCVTLEQIPGPGAFEARQEIVLENARKAAAAGKFCAVTITDSPGGTPAIATDVVCSEIRKLGIEPLVHVALRDRSRNQVESILFQLAALGINNVLILTGDYPSNLGFRGRSMPVFDLDSVNGLLLARAMNQGMEREIMRKQTRLAPTEFFTGVAFSPYKQLEGEVMGQYYKLKQKIVAGANFAITQVGYDARKLQELQLWLKQNRYDLPVLAGIYILSYPVAQAMHSNKIPGCVVTEKLLKQLAGEAELPDKGRAARLERAAKMFAVIKGLGYKGAYLSGQGLPYEQAEYVIQRGNELVPKWHDFLSELIFPRTTGFIILRRIPLTV